MASHKRLHRKRQVQRNSAEQEAYPQASSKPHPIVALQGLVGNQAVMRMLKDGHPMIQRLAVNGTNWDDVGSARGSEAGASGGVMLVSDVDPDSAGIVLKGMKSANQSPGAVTENNPNRTIISHRLLEEVGGIEAGGTRVVEGGEKTTVETTLENLPNDQKKGSFATRLQFLKDSERILVMDRFSGQTLRDLALGPATRLAENQESEDDKTARIARYQQFVRTFQNKAFLINLGKMLAVDTFLGNRDRVHAGGINFGNLMVSDEYAIQAIDSDSQLDQIDKGNLTTNDMSGVEAIASGNVTATVDKLIAGIKTALTTNDYRLLNQYLTDNNIDIFAGFDYVKQGVKIARQIIIKSQQYKAIVGSSKVYKTKDFDPRQLERRRKYLKYRRGKKVSSALKKVLGNKKIQ